MCMGLWGRRAAGVGERRRLSPNGRTGSGLFSLLSQSSVNVAFASCDCRKSYYLNEKKASFRASDRIEAGRIFECSTKLCGQQLKKDPSDSLSALPRRTLSLGFSSHLEKLWAGADGGDWSEATLACC